MEVKGVQFRDSVAAGTGAKFPTKKSDGHIHLHVGRSSRRSGWQYLTSEESNYDKRVKARLKGDKDKPGQNNAQDALIDHAMPWDPTNVHSNTGANVKSQRKSFLQECGDEYLPENERTAELEYIFRLAVRVTWSAT